MESRPDIESLQRLYAALDPAEKADLLEELLVAAARGEDEANVVLNAWLLDQSIRSDIRMLPTNEHQTILWTDAAWTTSEGSGILAPYAWYVASYTDI